MLFRKKPQPQLSIAIPEPCKENWDGMHVVDDVHRHCDSCAKNVVDFTAMSDDEVVSFFRDNKSHVCGRFKKEQLNRPYTPLPQTTRPATWWKAAMLLPLTLFAKNSSAQQNDSVPAGDSLLVNGDSLQTPMESVVDSTLVEVDSLNNPNDSIQVATNTSDTAVPPEVKFLDVEVYSSGGTTVSFGWCVPQTYLTGNVAPLIRPISGSIALVEECVSPGPPPPPTLNFITKTRWYEVFFVKQLDDELGTASPNDLAAGGTDQKNENSDPPTLPERPWYEAIIPERLRSRKA